MEIATITSYVFSCDIQNVCFVWSTGERNVFFFFSKEPFRWSLETRRIDLRISLVATSKGYFLWKKQFFSGGKNRSGNIENGIEDKRQECNQYNNLVTAEYCHKVTGCSSFSVSRKLQAASYELTVSSFISKESSIAHKFSSVNTYLWNYLFLDKLTMTLMQVEIITIYIYAHFIRIPLQCLL